MKHTLRNATALLLMTTSGAALAHPGNHEALTVSEQATHFTSDPWHVAATIAVAAVFVLGIRSLRLRSRRDR